jgi:hypothetical protein
MTKLASLLAAAALLAACGNEIDPNDVRDALPKAEAIRIGTPSPAAAEGTLTAAQSGPDQQAAPTYASEYAVKSYWMAVTVNVGVWWTLKTIEVITAFPPASCDDERCTWGPWHDQNNFWQLEVRRSGDGYAYDLSARPGSLPASPFEPIVSGIAYPGQDRRHGRGSFTVDFDAEAALDHGILWVQDSFGTLDVTYDNRTALAVDCTFLGARGEDDGRLMNAVYAFDATDAGGELQVAFRTLEGTAQQLSLRTRWNEVGAGRGDARFYSTDGSATLIYEASECWGGAPAFALSYDTDPSVGAESACAYPAVSYADLAVP